MEIFEFGETSSKIALLQPVDEHDMETIENEAALIRENTKKDFLLRAFKVKNWNKDLSPWEAPAVFGNEDFGSGANKMLAKILDTCDDNTVKYYIGGYSLAGLFALWSAYQTPIFSGVAAASPSMWFPGFLDYMRENKFKSQSVYLSLGDKEGKTRNPVMATVNQRMHEAVDVLNSGGTTCFFEWNKGNHFREPDLRTAKAFAWLIQQREPSPLSGA